MTLLSILCVALLVFALVVVWSLVEFYLALRKEKSFAPKMVYPLPKSQMTVKSPA